MSEVKKIHIEVAYALPHKQVVIALEVEAGVTMFDAVVRSGIAAQFPGMIDPEQTPMGVFAQIETSPKLRILADGERVELYRPLTASPNDSRKQRAQQARQKRTHGE